MKLATLVIKNIAERRLFFAPLNKKVHPGETVDILAMCGGNSDQAARVVDMLRKDLDWQVFEVLAGPLPSPEGELGIVAAPGVAPYVSEMPPQSKGTPGKSKKSKGGQFDKTAGA